MLRSCCALFSEFSSIAVLAALFLLLAPSAARAQATFATITGVVTDSTSARIAGVEVVARQVETNYRSTATSNETGAYNLPQLREGHYVLTARGQGFKEYTASDITLVARDVRRIDIQLEVGDVRSTIEVSAGGGSLIETETARIADMKTSEVMQNLPSNTRSATGLLSLTSGVFSTSTNGVSTIRFAGSRTGQEGYTLDGVSFGNGIDAGSLPVAGFMESFQEMRVDLANNTADLGTIGQMTLVTKSGGNNVHGSGFDYYRTNGLAARNPFSATKTSSVSHDFGGSIGGPVFLPKIYNGRNKTFFYFSWEGQLGGTNHDLLNPTVAPQSWRNGDFSAAGVTIYDPAASVKTPFPGNIIPTSRLNGVSQKIQDRFFPLPNQGGANVYAANNYQQVMNRPYDPNTLWTPRIDHRFSDKDSVYFRYTWSRSWGRSYDGNLPTIGQRYMVVDTRHSAFSYTRVLKPNLLNEFTAGMVKRPADRHPALYGNEVDSQLGLQGLVPNIPNIQGIPSLSFSNLTMTGLSVSYTWIIYRSGPVYEFRDNLSYFVGHHSIKTGINLSRDYWTNTTASTSLFGSMSFSNLFTGFTYADFMLGYPTSSGIGYPPVLGHLRRSNYEAYVTDSFKVSSRLTLDLGLRYELHVPWTDRDGMISAFDIGTGSLIVPDAGLKSVSPLMPASYVKIATSSSLGLPSNGFSNTQHRNFAPRIGVAWRPFGTKTVLRAGYGIFYDAIMLYPSFSSTPFSLTLPTYTNSVSAPIKLPIVYPSTIAALTSVSLPRAVDPNLKNPYSMQYNATVEHQRWGTGFRISFIASNTRQGIWSYNVNQPWPSTGLYINQARRYPQYPAISYNTNGAGHQYNSGVVEATRRLGSNLIYQFTYTLARDIQDLERSSAPENAYDRKRERAVWTDIPTHRVTSYVMYKLPFGMGKKLFGQAGRVTDALLGGWELSAIFLRSSGQFLTPSWTGPDPTGTAYTTSATPASVTLRPNCLSNSNLSSDQRSLSRWFDTSAFSAPTKGSFGSCAKGVIIGPGVMNLHSGLAKSFALTEHAKFRTEITATDVLNHPNWANPSLDMTSPASFGRISAASGTRSVRIAARVDF
jgi:hypothetical protein